MVVAVRVVPAGERSVGLVRQRHRGLDWVGQRPWGSGIRVSRGISRGVRGGVRGSSGWRSRAGWVGRRGPGRGVGLAGRSAGVVVGGSLGGRVQGQGGEGGGEVLQQLLLLRLPGVTEVGNFALKLD